MIETKENYKELGFDLILMIREKCKAPKRQLSKSEARREVLCEIKKCLASEKIFFLFVWFNCKGAS